MSIAAGGARSSIRPIIRVERVTMVASATPRNPRLGRVTTRSMGPATVEPELPKRNMAVRSINRALRGINLETSSLRGNANENPEPIRVCTATVADWNLYVKSNSQVMKPKFMEWHDNAIWIVEYPGAIHSAASAAVLSAMLSATGTGNRHLTPHYDPHSERPPAGEPNIEPDCAFGPRRSVGAVLPPGLTRWIEYHTVKVEVGVSQDWPGLDRKAALWKARVGVEFVLSIRLSPALRVCQYRLEQRMNGQFPDDANRAPILPIDANAVLEFDAHQLLGLPADAALPDGFNDPVRIDLFDEVVRVLEKLKVMEVMKMMETMEVMRKTKTKKTKKTMAVTVEVATMRRTSVWGLVAPDLPRRPTTSATLGGDARKVISTDAPAPIGEGALRR